MSDQDTLTEIRKLAVGGLLTDGGHHKQWFLSQIAELAGLQMPPSNSGEVVVFSKDSDRGYDILDLEPEVVSAGDFYLFDTGLAP